MTNKKKNVKMPKEHNINVRCTEQQKDILEAVATRQGLGVSTLLLQLGLLHAEEKRMGASK